MNRFEPGVPIAVADTQIPVKRILGRNPGPMTGPGTNSYLIGTKTLCLVDPGPRDDIQLENFMTAIGGAKLDSILVTHTHGDHSPGAQQLQEATGAQLVGLVAPIKTGHDASFKPDKQWQDGDEIVTDEYRIKLIHTPGHVSNHFCFLLQEDQLLFTGDHVLEGTTSVILPPDGDMGAYLDSLNYLLTLPLKYLAPGHGELMADPAAELKSLIAHRLKREQKVLDGLSQLGSSDLDRLVVTVYDDVAEHLIPWAKKTLLAHLIKLKAEKRVDEISGNWQLL